MVNKCKKKVVMEEKWTMWPFPTLGKHLIFLASVYKCVRRACRQAWVAGLGKRNPLKKLLAPNQRGGRDVLGRAETWVRGFVACFLRVPQLYCSFPAAQASKRNSQKMVYKTSYSISGPS